MSWVAHVGMGVGQPGMNSCLARRGMPGGGAARRVAGLHAGCAAGARVVATSFNSCVGGVGVGVGGPGKGACSRILKNERSLAIAWSDLAVRALVAPPIVL